MELPATQAMDDELPPTQDFANDEENGSSPVGMLIVDGTSHPILPGITSIGRHSGCNVWINDATVSGKHAEIDAGALKRTIFIKDLESTNKTKINGTKLRPGSNYQIKDGDKLYFGSIIAEFKLFQPVEDSLMECTPQINRKIRSVIPGTPDSINASSASEGDVSVIPGTQNDVDTCFRRPETSNKTSTDKDLNSPRIPAFSMDDFENSIYSAETQKSIESKLDGNDENIYELETQRPSDIEKEKSTIKDIEKEKSTIEDIEKEKSTIEDLETQRFDPKINSTTGESHNISIYSAETQKQLPEEDTNNSTRKSADVSIHSAATQKRLSETSKLNNVSIYSAETQKAVSEDDSLENLETQQFVINKPDSSVKKYIETSVDCVETLKVVPDVNVDESIENMETQQVNARESHIFQTPNLPKRKSIKIPLSEMETQKYDPDSSLVNNESLEDAETERFECENFDSEKRKSEMFTPKKILETESIHEAETQKYLPDTSTKKVSNGDESIDDLETQQFIINNPNVVINESIDKIVPQEPANSTSIEDMETMPFNEEIPPLNQNNQHDSKNVEEANNKDIIDQSGTVQNKKIDSSLHNNSSINNIDISENAEHEDEGEMFSQNLIGDCPFAFLPEESQENIEEEDTSKTSEELKQENQSNAKDNISNLSVEISNKSSISVDKEAAPSEGNDSETDEEGIFSNPTPRESNSKTNIEKSNSDSETDEEGVFSSHMSKESENTEINDRNKHHDNTETDEGVFSNPSKSNEKLNNENNETGSETDEEGFFSNSLSKPSETDKTETKISVKNNKNESTAENDTSKIDADEILDNSLKATNEMKEENNRSKSEPSKVQSSSFKQNSLIRHSPIPDSDDSLFDDNNDDEKSNLSISEKSTLKIDKSFNQTGNSSAIKDKQSTLNKDVKNTNDERSDEEVASIVPKGKSNEVGDLAPTQDLDTSKSIINESDTEDECLPPTQVISPKKVPTNISDKEDDLLAPTEPMVREKSPVKKISEKSEDVNLSPTQKMDTQDCTELLPTTEEVKSSSNHENDKIERNGSVEDLDYEMASTQPIEDTISKDLINSPKRQLEELEIICNKKLKSDEIQTVDEDSIIEKDLKKMFDGSEEDKMINQGPELLTQQLEDILQSSQIEEDPMENVVILVPSPTLSCSRKSSKSKSRRKGVQLKNTNTSSQEKKVNVDLNDTIERNLNDMFNASINDVESYESDSMLTQQLANVLESQENVEANVKETETKVSPNLPKRTSRSSLNKPSSAKGKNNRKSKTLAASPVVSPVKEEPKSKKSEESAEESQETEEYFANLKSKKKRASAILDTQSQEEQASDDEKELVYKHGIVGFVDDIGAIRTNKRVPLYEPKGRPFTSDSQSEGEDPDSSHRQKRLSLSLSKKVDLNSSLSDWDLETTMSKPSAGKEVKRKRVMAKGTRGFELRSGAPVESEELVSAPSTEGEEELGSSQQKVSSAGGVGRGAARRRPPLAITRSKRTASEDNQNQPPKRAKTQNDHVKLQELLVVISPLRNKLIPYRSQQALRIIDNNGTNDFRQNVNEQPKKAEQNQIKFPKPSESYVVLHRTKSKADSSESKSSDKTLQNKGDSEVKSNSRRNAARTNETTETLENKGESEIKYSSRRNRTRANEAKKAETSIAKGLSSSKDSVVVEDSDVESSTQISTRATRSRRNKDANSSVAKSDSKVESSGSSSDDVNKSTRSTRGKTVRENQKKAEPIKNKAIIPDSDQESDESMNKSKEEKTVRKTNLEKTEESKKSTIKSTRSRRVKDSDSEKLEDSEISVNTSTRSRQVRNASSKIVVSQDSDSEFSGGTKSNSKKQIGNKRNVKHKIDSDSERSTSPEKYNKLDIPAENKKPRNTRRAKAQNSSDSVFSESDNDQSKNSSVANASQSSRSVRQTRKRGATDAISSESQEMAEFTASSVEKNASRTRSGRTTKKTNASGSSSSQSMKDDSQSDDTADKSTNRSKRARVNKSIKDPRCSRSPTPSQSLLTPTRSRRSSVLSPLRGSNHKVLFTGEKSEAHKNIVSKLGASVIDDPAKCTILVTDKVRRTCKFLCCVARGIPIVSFKWLDASLNARHFVDWEDYILEDPISEAQYKYNLQESLKKARGRQFLEGYTVLLLQIPAKLLSAKELKDIVASSGGKPLFRVPAKWLEKSVVVTTEDKLQNVKKLIAKAPKSITIHSTEFLFTGILRQEVNLQEFKLSS